MSTNILINSRSMNGIITISDGSATLENGDLTCDDINSSTINSGIFTCQGEFRCNLVGLYTIPTLVSSDYGLLISYGNTSGNGATDFTNYQSTYNITKGGFNFWNKSSSQTLTNLAIIDNSQTYFKSQLTGCTAETPLNTTSIVNKTYVDSNFVDRTNNLTQNINGLKTFTNDTNFIGSLLAKTNLKMNSVGFKTGNAITLTFPLEALTILAQTSGSTTTLQLPTITANELGMVFTFFKRGASPFTTTINATNQIFLSNSTSSSLTNSTLLDTTKHLTKLLVSQAGVNFIWIEVTDYSLFDRDQNNLLYARLASPNAFTNTNTFNSFLPTSTLTPSSGTQLITKTYVDDNFLDRTNNLTQNINGLKTFTDTTTFTSGLKTDSILVNNNNINFGICLANTNTSIKVGNASNSLTIETPRITLKPSSNTYSADIEQSGINFFIKNNNLNGTLDFRVSTNAVVLLLDVINTTISNNLISNSQATFNNLTPICSVASPTANNHLTRKDYVDNNFLDRTNNLTQNINGPKTFTDDLTAPNIYCNTALYFRDINLGLNKALIFHQADIVYFDTLTVFDNYWKFKCFNIEQVVISQLSSTFNNKLISLAQARFDNFTPTCTVLSPTQINHLTRKDYVDTNFLDRTNNLTQNINGLKTFTNDTTFNAQSTFNTICPISNTNATLTNHLTTLGFNNGKYIDFITDQTITGTKRLSNFFCTALNITPTSGGIGNRQQIYMTGTELAFVPQFNNNNYAFYCKDSVPTQTKPVNINSVSTTINNLLVSNNITSPTTISTNNIYTNLISGGIINIGSTSSICNFDSIPTFNSDTTFVGNIFSETAIYFKDIGIGSQLNQARIFKQDDYLYFDTNINYTNGYSFRTSSNDTLTITSALTTINNGLTSNGEATFNNFTPICSVANPTANNHLVRKDYCDNNFMSLTVSQTKSGTVNFLNQITFNGGSGGGTAINCINGLNANTFLNVAGQASFSSSLISNNLTSPTSTSVNNIYTTLVSGGEINIGGSLSANYIFGQTTFNSTSIFNLGCTFLDSLTFFNSGTYSEIQQTTGSNLVIRNTTNSRDIILSTTSASTGQVDSLSINTTSCDILSPTLNLTSSSTINILTPNNLTGVINFLNTLTTATVNFCSTAYTSIFNLNARLAHKGVQYMNEVKIISGTSLTLAFPLEQRWQFTSTGATQIVIDLPQLTATSQTGFNFSILKTASNTNSVKFNRKGTNVIRGLNSITDLTTITVISGTSVFGGFLTAELSSGNFAWIYI